MGSPRRGDTSDDRVPGDQLLFRAKNFVLMSNPGPAGANGFDVNCQEIVEIRSGVVLAGQFGNDQEGPVCLQFAVLNAGSPKHFDSSVFEVVWVGRVVHMSLGIGLLVPSPQ